MDDNRETSPRVSARNPVAFRPPPILRGNTLRPRPDIGTADRHGSTSGRSSEANRHHERIPDPASPPRDRSVSRSGSKSALSPGRANRVIGRMWSSARLPRRTPDDAVRDAWRRIRRPGSGDGGADEAAEADRGEGKTEGCLLKKISILISSWDSTAERGRSSSGDDADPDDSRPSRRHSEARPRRSHPSRSPAGP
jgi:hypothetical protein